MKCQTLFAGASETNKKKITRQIIFYGRAFAQNDIIQKLIL